MRGRRPFRARCAALRLAPGYLLPQTQTDLPLWVGGQIGFIFLPRLHRGHTPCCQSVARQVEFHRGCLRVYFITTNTARAATWGIKGGDAPFAGGPGTRRFLAYLCLLSLRKKVGRGAGRSARSWGPWGASPPTLGSAEGASAPSQRGSRVPHPPAVEREKRGAGAKSADLLPRGAPEVRPLAKSPRPRGAAGGRCAVPAGGKCNSCTHGYHSCTNCAAGPALCYHRARRRNTP